MRKILVAEDNADLGKTLVELLESFGHETHLVTTGTAAISAAKTLSPDVILMDIGMPEMDGLEASRAILAAAATTAATARSPTIIALTGRGQMLDQLEIAAAGIDFHLVKPVDPEALRKMLSN